MAFAALIGPLVSGLASAVGAMAQASALNQQADEEEKIAKFNADRDLEQAAYAQSKGAQEAEQRKKEGERQAAIARAARAQGGVATTSGSSLLLESEFASETSYNERVAMFNATKEQKDFVNKAKIGEYEGKVRANATRARAKAAIVGGFAGVAKGFAGAFG